MGTEKYHIPRWRAIESTGQVSLPVICQAVCVGQPQPNRLCATCQACHDHVGVTNIEDCIQLVFNVIRGLSSGIGALTKWKACRIKLRNLSFGWLLYNMPKGKQSIRVLLPCIVARRLRPPNNVRLLSLQCWWCQFIDDITSYFWPMRVWDKPVCNQAYTKLGILFVGLILRILQCDDRTFFLTFISPKGGPTFKKFLRGNWRVNKDYNKRQTYHPYAHSI